MGTVRKDKPRPAVRVRYDPPTLEEAVFAAMGLTDDTALQAELAAELMGTSVEEATELVRKAALAAKRAQATEVAFATNRSGEQRAVVVERKTERRSGAVVVERKGAPKIERSGGVIVERKPFRGLGGGQPRTLIRLGGPGR
jgi:hypothetical protein